jgi:hypothetical protein
MLIQDNGYQRYDDYPQTKEALRVQAALYNFFAKFFPQNFVSIAHSGTLVFVRIRSGEAAS